MDEQNGIPKRLRELESIVSSLLGLSEERQQRLLEWTANNDKDHRHINDHMDRLERSMTEVVRVQEKTATKVGAMIAVASSGLTFIYFLFGR